MLKHFWDCGTIAEIESSQTWGRRPGSSGSLRRVEVTQAEFNWDCATLTEKGSKKTKRKLSTFSALQRLGVTQMHRCNLASDT